MDDAMQVVGHELEGEESDLGVELGDFTPALCYAFTQGRWIEPRLGVVAIGALNSTQQGAAPFDSERDHVDAGRLVIMMVVAPFHGLLPSQFGVGCQPLSLPLAQGHGGVVIIKAEP